MLVSTLNDFLTSRFSGMNLQNFTNDEGTVVVVSRPIDKVETDNGLWKFYVEPTPDERLEQPGIEIVHVFSVNNEFEAYPHYRLSMKEPRKDWQTGDVFTTQEFNECVNCGAFMDYDGHGDAFNKDTNEVYNCYLNVQQLAALKYNPEVTHIIWYNK